MEKKKRKQERKLLKSQNKLLAGDLFHTPGSDSDSGVSQSTDSESTPHTGPQPSTHRQHTEHICDQHPRHQRASTVNETAEPMDPANGITRAPTLQKLSPFSVESLLAESSPRRKTILDFSQLPPQRPLVGKGHFLLYPITQPLGFIVPQTAAMKPSQDSGHSGHNCSSTTDISTSNQKDISHLCKDTELQRESKNSSSIQPSNKCFAESNSFENDSESIATNSSQKESISPNLSEYADRITNKDGEDVDMD